MSALAFSKHAFALQAASLRVNEPAEWSHQIWSLSAVRTGDNNPSPMKLLCLATPLTRLGVRLTPPSSMKVLEQKFPLFYHSLVQRHVLRTVDFAPLAVGGDSTNGEIRSGN